MNTNDRLILIVKKYSKDDSSLIDLSSSIHKLNFDSLSFLEFQMAIDNEFSIEIKIDDFLQCSTVSDISTLIEKYCNLK